MYFLNITDIAEEDILSTVRYIAKKSSIYTGKIPIIVVTGEN